MAIGGARTHGCSREVLTLAHRLRRTHGPGQDGARYHDRAEASYQPTGRQGRQVERYESARYAQRSRSSYDSISSFFHRHCAEQC